jgi:hypothetical protein
LGTIKDKETGNIIAYANVTIEKNGNVLMGMTSDINGNYMFENVLPDAYDIFIGYETVQFKQFKVEENQNYSLDVELKPNSQLLMDFIEVQGYSYEKTGGIKHRRRSKSPSYSLEIRNTKANPIMTT